MAYVFESGQNIVVEISDNGIGISGKDTPFVFEKYFRVNTGNIHNIKGYGIGLSYVKEIMKLHHGKVELESKLGQGSVFQLIFPKN